MKYLIFILFASSAFAQNFNDVLNTTDDTVVDFGSGVLSTVERLELTGGYGESTDNYRLTMHWHLFSRVWRSYDVDFSLAANYSVFDGETRPDGETPEMKDVGLTPTITLFTQRSYWGFRPYVEAGVGVHYLTDKSFTTKNFSTNFQFGDHIGVGVRFGAKNNMRIGYQFQHLSNAGIDNPNPGINFHLVNFGYKFK